MRNSNDIWGAVGIVMMTAVAIFLAVLVTVAKLMGLPLLDVLKNVQVLWIGFGLLTTVVLIQKTGMPLPFRLSNTWPVIVGAFWIALQRLLAMKVEQTALEEDIGASFGLSASPVDYPLYAQSWATWLVFLAIIVLGYCYCIRKHTNRF